jgi:hypothetical protein
MNRNASRTAARWAYSIFAGSGLVGDRPQRRHTLHRREGEVIAGDRLGSRPRVLGDRGGQLPGILRLASVLRNEELPRHLGADPGPIRSRYGPVLGHPGGLVQRGEPLRHLNPERRHVRLVDLERRTQPGHRLVVQHGQVRALQLPLTLRSQRMQPGPEQRPHLLRGHHIAGVEAVDPDQPRAHPHPGSFPAFGVVRRQPEMPLLGRVQGGDLPRQIVIPRPRSELVNAHRHTPRSRSRPLRRSVRRHGIRQCKEVCGTSDLEIGWGYMKQVQIVVMTARAVAAA